MTYVIAVLTLKQESSRFLGMV